MKQKLGCLIGVLLCTFDGLSQCRYLQGGSQVGPFGSVMSKNRSTRRWSSSRTATTRKYLIDLTAVLADLDAGACGLL